MALFLLLLLPSVLSENCQHHSKQGAIELSSPSQQEFTATLTLVKAGMLTTIEALELDEQDMVASLDPNDLALLLSVCKGFELTGVELTSAQWRALAQRSRRDDWAPEWISLENTGSEWDNLNDVQFVFAFTSEVWLSEVDLKKAVKAIDSWAPARNSSSTEQSRLLKKNTMLEIWYNNGGTQTSVSRAVQKLVEGVMREGARVAREEVWGAEGVLRMVY